METERPDSEEPHQSGYGHIEQPQPTYDEKQFAMFCHFAAFAGLIIPFGSIIGPLVMWLMKKHESAYIDFHGREALNFNITMAIASVICIVLMFVFIGIVLFPVLLIFWLIMLIIAGVKANDGIMYRYPISIRLVN
ncbi:DUF4870 domain-containing protein [Pleionea sediminis]|uniref:DUF4870 domain-containing protein n=1 Tax=Pleionea sediminis TaxID=2569479 RepID=UPI0011861B78|nr:DUF4870 domain-containing protein [Pleionea sediminis]